MGLIKATSAPPSLAPFSMRDVEQQAKAMLLRARQQAEALLAEALRRDVHVVVGAIDSENTGSLAFHRALGFEEVGRMPEVGRKFGRWLDVVLMQRMLEGATPAS